MEGMCRHVFSGPKKQTVRVRLKHSITETAKPFGPKAVPRQHTCHRIDISVLTFQLLKQIQKAPTLRHDRHPVGTGGANRGKDVFIFREGSRIALRIAASEVEAVNVFRKMLPPHRTEPHKLRPCTAECFKTALIIKAEGLVAGDGDADRIGGCLHNVCDSSSCGRSLELLRHPQDPVKVRCLFKLVGNL